jgi:hypothetical protein
MTRSSAANSKAGSDFAHELGLNSFFFAWNNYLRTPDGMDPRSFYATGTPTLVPPPAVPEPTSVLLVVTGLAGFGFVRPRKS